MLLLKKLSVVKTVQFKITDCSVSLGTNTILKNLNLEIRDGEKIAVVGRNGCGKTTLLKLISGDLLPDRNDLNQNYGIIKANVGEIGVLRQNAFKDDTLTLLQAVRSAYPEILETKRKLKEIRLEMETEPTDETIRLYSSLEDHFRLLGGYYFEKEYETAIKKFGFTEEDKSKKIYEFSGGQQTKIAFIKLLLSRPDILLLDEPTNHLDISSVEWLEDYISKYPKAVVIVSHDRMFLDRTVSRICEISNGHLREFSGNYTEYVEKKKLADAAAQKQFLQQQKEIERLQAVADRFRYKATKAAMAQSKLKQIEKMDIIEAPESEDTRRFCFNPTPAKESYKEVFEATDLEIGYDKPLSVVNLKIQKGEKIGIVGDNGLGKSTFLKTIVGKIPQISGKFELGRNVQTGYFDQQTAQDTSEKSVLQNFWDEFPAYTQTEARNILGSFLFTGDEVLKPVCSLSGGEKVRLGLCKLFCRRPNFLILDEPTNHMDIIGKETLEEILSQFTGTVIFVSHDRYFIKKTADKILEFSKSGTVLYPYGYEQYISSQNTPATEQKADSGIKKVKKAYTTPLKEKARREKKIKAIEQEIESTENLLKNLNAEMSDENTQSDYVKLSDISNRINDSEEKLLELMTQWEELQTEETE